jgi:FkbM family methyltransferase
MYTFKNTILIVVFNYSNCIFNKNLLKNIYKNHFKEIIFYSNYPIIEGDNEINFIDIQNGYYLTKIFNHFYTNYKSLIDDCDGLFYTMDDNIINVNILNLFKNDKIIFYKPNHENMDNNIVKYGNMTNYSWFKIDYIENHLNGNWYVWWERFKLNINNLLNDDEFKIYNITKFSASFSDWFYLPKKYLTNLLFTLFDLFSKHDIFLEIAISTIIHHIEHDLTAYQDFNNEVLHATREKFLDKKYIYNSLNHNHNFILHPIKFNENPATKDWLIEFFNKEKCVIITTINKPTETILKHISNPEYDVIIIGDCKTPSDYYNLNCIYLDIASQKKLFPEICDLFPYNHYCRKNLGYLYAIKKGYKIIYETDDDNIPYDNFDNILNYNNIKMITEKNNKWINVFKYFTNNAHIWPRGYPLSLVKTNTNYLIENTDKKPSIINGLVENDPDVDALFRIICNHEGSIKWEKNKTILINNKNICVFNTQNTFWLNPELFICLLIPSSVSFRYCDILKGIIANIILEKTDNYMMYSSPNVVQNRNEHNLISDFKSEYEMYIHNENILNFIENNIDDTKNNIVDNFLYIIQTSSKLPDIYECLRKRNFILLSFKENTPDTTIFYPNSTWTTGRNKLREYVLNLKQQYNYYILLDEDVVFSDYSQEEGFNIFEELILKYNASVANPNFDGYYTETCNGLLPVEAQTTIWYDGMCNAFSREIFLSNIIFPYVDVFDNNSWWMSQYIMIILSSIYKKDVIVFNNLKVKNILHASYPKENIFKIAEEYVFNNLINTNSFNLFNKIENKGFFKICDFLNILFQKFNKVNIIDVGCAIGDFKRFLNINNGYYIGIDPLINDYKNTCPNNLLNEYNILYDCAIDNNNEKKNFNITKSRDTSSLCDFDTENITSDINDNINKFFIPEESQKFVTEIVEKKIVETKTLKSIIEDINLNNNIIHILKVDAQGNDLNVIKSANSYIKNIMFIIIESTIDSSSTLYKNTSKFSEDNNYLELNKFKLLDKCVLLRDEFDCLYYNTDLVKDFDFNWDKKEFFEAEINYNINTIENLNYNKKVLFKIYNNLLENKVIKKLDIDILYKWINYF